MTKIELNQPITHQGEEVTELNLNFDELTGEDLIQAESEHAMIFGAISNVPELSKTYLISVAAKAAKMPLDDMRKLNAKDFSRVTLETQNFLMM